MRHPCRPRILLVSLGQLNGLLLKLLSRRTEIGEIVVATRDEDRAVPILNLARTGAAAEGIYPRIRSQGFDLNRGESAAEILRQLQPDVTFVAPSLQSWWVLDRIPPEASAPLRRAGFGAWLPFQLLPMIRFMKAWKEAGLRSPVIAAPYPDVVNPVLAARGLAPTCGAGNLDEIVPKIQCLLADHLSIAPQTIRARLVAHHALERYVYTDSPPTDQAPPYLLSVDIEDRKFGDEEELRALLFQSYPLAKGLDFHFLTVCSAIRLIIAFLQKKDGATRIHVPGPEGLPGGYPVQIVNGGVRLDLAPCWTRDAAIRVNSDSHRWDGIEAVEEDGTVVWTAQSAGILRETLGLDRPRMTFDETEDVVLELRCRFDDYICNRR